MLAGEFKLFNLEPKKVEKVVDTYTVAYTILVRFKQWVENNKARKLFLTLIVKNVKRQFRNVSI